MEIICLLYDSLHGLLSGFSPPDFGEHALRRAFIFSRRWELKSGGTLLLILSFALKLGSGYGTASNFSDFGDGVALHSSDGCAPKSDSRWDRAYPKADNRGLLADSFGVHDAYGQLIMWHNESFITFRDGLRVFGEMSRKGVFDGKDSGEVIFLVQDFNPDACFAIRRARHDGTYVWTSGVMTQLLRMHTIMTPRSIVILLDWTDQVKSACRSFEKWDEGAYGPSYYTVRQISYIANHFSQQRIHCVGMSLGATVCALMARRYESYHRGHRKFARIVALDPPYESFSGYYSDPNVGGLMRLMVQNGIWMENWDAEKMINKHDANYVVVIASSMGSYGINHPWGDEFIRSSLWGNKHEACESRAWWEGFICAWSYEGRQHCEYIHIPFQFSRTDGLCYHLMAALTYMKSLDTRQAVQTLSYSGNMPSAWSSYVTSRDYSNPAEFFSPDVVDSRMLLRERDLASSDLLLVVSEGNSVELWTSDPYFTRLEGVGGGYTERWYFVKDLYLGDEPLYLYGRYGGLLKFVRLYRGIGTMKDGLVGMTTHSVREFTCYHTYTYYLTGTKKYDCHPHGPFDVPRWRSMMNVTGVSHPEVPPACHCLRYHKVYKDYVQFTMPPVTAKVGESVTLGPFGNDLQAVLTYKNGRNRVVLVSYWNACFNYSRRISMQVHSDRYSRTVRLTSFRAVTREVWVVFEVTTVKLNVTWVGSNSRIRRFAEDDAAATDVRGEVNRTLATVEPWRLTGWNVFDRGTDVTLNPLARGAAATGIDGRGVWMVSNPSIVVLMGMAVASFIVILLAWLRWNTCGGSRQNDVYRLGGDAKIPLLT